MAGRVLIVDDEPIVREVLSRYLTRSGYEVETAEDGQEALDSLGSNPPDLVVLDIMLPRLDGLSVFARLRERADTPVILLTARAEEPDRVVGLEIGADDYVTKPFSPRELVARVGTVLRRSRGTNGPVTEAMRFGSLEIDPAAREVRRAERPVDLTPREFDLLVFLSSHPGRAFSRLELLDQLWDLAFDGDPSTVTVHVRRLREKIEEDPSRPRHVVTVWGVGYRFDP